MNAMMKTVIPSPLMRNMENRPGAALNADGLEDGELPRVRISPLSQTRAAAYPASTPGERAAGRQGTCSRRIRCPAAKEMPWLVPQWLSEPLSAASWRSAVSTTLASSIARVIGPTPPGFGETQAATSADVGVDVTDDPALAGLRVVDRG